MRPSLSTLAVLAAALAAPVAAHADTDTFTITGSDYSFSFDLPSTFPYGPTYTVNNVLVTYDGSSFDATVTFYDQTDFSVQDATDFAGYSSVAVTGYYTTDGSTNTFTQGSIPSFGSVNCSAALRMPGLSSMPTLALLQMPMFGTVCDDPTNVQISASTPSTAPTPEPASLLLLGTGALGLLGIGTRRLWS